MCDNLPFSGGGVLICREAAWSAKGDGEVVPWLLWNLPALHISGFAVPLHVVSGFDVRGAAASGDPASAAADSRVCSFCLRWRWRSASCRALAGKWCPSQLSSWCSEEPLLPAADCHFFFWWEYSCFSRGAWYAAVEKRDCSACIRKEAGREGGRPSPGSVLQQRPCHLEIKMHWRIPRQVLTTDLKQRWQKPACKKPSLWI